MNINGKVVLSDMTTLNEFDLTFVMVIKFKKWSIKDIVTGHISIARSNEKSLPNMIYWESCDFFRGYFRENFVDISSQGIPHFHFIMYNN